MRDDPTPRGVAPAPLGPPPLPRGVRLEVWAWSLALQAGWNPQRMQNLGLMTALVPWLARQRLPLPVLRRVCRRQFEYFNTNPYLANLAVGGLLRLEADNLAAGGRLGRQVVAFRAAVGRALASLGDQLVWLGLQPALLLAACALAWGGHAGASLALVAAFGAVELAARWLALGLGYRLGLDIVDLLSSPGWHRAIRAAQRAGMVLAGGLGGGYLLRLASSGPGGDGAALGSVGALVYCGVLLHRRLPGELVFLLGFPLALLLASL